MCLPKFNEDGGRRHTNTVLECETEKNDDVVFYGILCGESGEGAGGTVVGVVAQ